MNVIFKDADLKELIFHRTSKKYKKYAKRKDFVQELTTVYNILTAVENAEKLKQFGRLHYEPLKHEYSGCHSLRIRHGWAERLIVRETDNGISIEMLELNTDHYGNKK